MPKSSKWFVFIVSGELWNGSKRTSQSNAKRRPEPHNIYILHSNYQTIQAHFFYSTNMISFLLVHLAVFCCCCCSVLCVCFWFTVNVIKFELMASQKIFVSAIKSKSQPMSTWCIRQFYQLNKKSPAEERKSHRKSSNTWIALIYFNHRPASNTLNDFIHSN